MTDSLKGVTAVNKLLALGYSYVEGGVWVNDPSPTLRTAPAPIAWRYTGEAGFRKYLTDAQYRGLKPGSQAWYEPFKCVSCAADPDDSDINQVHAANAQVRYETWTPRKQQVRYWLPMEEAPTDGTLVRVFVQFTENSLEDASIPVWTIGCNFSDHQDDKEWLFAGWDWTHDCFTSGSGKPIGWLPMLEANIATPPAAGITRKK